MKKVCRGRWKRAEEVHPRGMAIVRKGEGGAGLARRNELAPLKGAAKKGGKKAAKKGPEKHAAKKHAAKKGPAKKAPGLKKAAKKAAKEAASKLLHGVERLTHEEVTAEDAELETAFHHLHRAAAVISLLKEDSGGDLKMLLEHGMELYRAAAGARRKKGTVRCAFGLLRAAEHLGMAGLYEARSEYRVVVAPPAIRQVKKQLEELSERLDDLGSPERENGQRLCGMARELLRRAEGAEHDPHLEYELMMAAEGICLALEEGL